MTVAPPEHEPIAQITMWREELTALHDRIAPRFARPEVRARAGRFLAGLLDPTERRNGWQLAEAVGERSPDGVQHQYAGTVGRIKNCQIGIFLAYASPCGRAFLARALYLPKAWAEDRLRRRAAGVPDESVFATKGELAQGAGTRWVIAEGFQCAKGEVGLGHYEVRRWEGWHRHVTLCLLRMPFSR